MKSHENSRSRRLPAKKRPSNRASCSHRIDWLFEQWKYWLTSTSHSRLHVPTLEFRSCIVIAEVRESYVLFSVATPTQQASGGLTDVGADFHFTTEQAKRVFREYHRLKDSFAASRRSAPGQPSHLMPSTWTDRPLNDWSAPSPETDIDLFIASLVGYWDACLTKPPLPEKWTGRTTRDFVMSAVVSEAPIPKFVCVEGLPPGLQRQLKRHLMKQVARLWRTVERQEFAEGTD